MMTIQESLHHKLTEAFRPTHLSVIDDSHHHATHASAPHGGDSHFTVIIASKDFEGLSKVARHRAITKLLDDEFQTKLHALSLKIYTPEEWIKTSK